MDLYYLSAIVGLMALMYALVAGCDRLEGSR